MCSNSTFSLFKLYERTLSCSVTTNILILQLFVNYMSVIYMMYDSFLVFSEQKGKGCKIQSYLNHTSLAKDILMKVVSTPLALNIYRFFSFILINITFFI